MNHQPCKEFSTCPPKLWITLWKTCLISPKTLYPTRLYALGLKKWQENNIYKSYGYENTLFFAWLAPEKAGVKRQGVHK
jgi:hypothetical protein